jgi:hypothetical protein
MNVMQILLGLLLMVAAARKGGSSSAKTQQKTTAKTVSTDKATEGANPMTLAKNQARLVQIEEKVMASVKPLLEKIKTLLNAGTAKQDKSVRDLGETVWKALAGYIRIDGDYEKGHLVQTVAHPLYPGWVMDIGGSKDKPQYYWREVKSVEGEIATLTTNFVRDPHGQAEAAVKAAAKTEKIALAFGFSKAEMPNGDTLWLCPGCDKYVSSVESHSCYRNGDLV